MREIGRPGPQQDRQEIVGGMTISWVSASSHDWERGSVDSQEHSQIVAPDDQVDTLNDPL